MADWVCFAQHEWRERCACLHGEDASPARAGIQPKCLNVYYADWESLSIDYS